MKRVVIALLALVFATAASPSDVAPDLGTRGYYIEEGNDVSQAVVSEAVSDARSEGSEFFLVVLAIEPDGGSALFSENTLDEVGGTGTVLTIGSSTVGWSSQDDVFTRAELNDALDLALTGGTDTEIVTLFLASLTGSNTATEADGGGLSWGLIFFVLIAAGIGFAIWRGSQTAKRRHAASMDDARANVQERLNDVAADIIDLDAEIGLSDHTVAKQHYTVATMAFANVSEEFPKVATADGLLDLAYDLDIAIWNLDTADALLDGEPLPDKPEKPEKPVETVQPSGPSTATQVPARSSTPRSSARIHPPPVPKRRPQRRSTPDTTAMMQGMLAGSMMRSMQSKGSSRGSGSRSRSRSRSRSSSRSSGTRMRGGGKRRG